MRRILGLSVVLAVLWSLWWGFWAFGISRGAQAWLADQRAQGWQADVSQISRAGFPSRIDVTLEELDLADPATGLAFGFPKLELSLRAIWPGDAALTFPNTPIRVATPTGSWRVLAEDARADLALHPGLARELEALSATSGPFRIEDSNSGALLGGEALTLAITQTVAPEVYAVRFDVPNFRPGDALRDNLRISEDLPLIFDTTEARAAITFDRALDRRSVEEGRAQPQKIVLDLVEAQWAEMRFLATGAVTRDADGLAEGSLTIKAENWQQMLDLAENAGVLAAQMRPRVEFLLSSLGRGTGATEDLDVTLTFEGGLTRLGFVPLGRAPSLVIR